MNPSLSIIIPIYNAAPYLHRCIDSILSQSFTDYELLLIDDGSTDESGVICDEYAPKDARIKVFHKENGGVSSARNLGLDNARGEWIYFVDADDEVLRNGLQILYNLITKDSDLIFAGYERYNECNRNIFKVVQKNQYVLSVEEAVEYVYNAPLYGYMGYLWCKLFRLSIINENHLRFNEKIYFNEDRLFIIQYICESSLRECVITTVPVYKYIVHNNSAMSQLSNHFNKNFITDLDAEMQMADCINNCHFSKHISQMAEEGVIASYYRIRLCMRRNNYCHLPTILNLTRRIGVSNYIKYIKIRTKKFFRKIIKVLCPNSSLS